MGAPAALIAKAILGSIGGGFTGAAKGATANKAENASNVQINNSTGETFQQAGAAIGNAIKDAKEKSDDEAKDSNNLNSDAALKQIWGDNISDELIQAFARISAADFTYKPEAQKKYSDNPNMDGKEHIGVIAQQLEANPATSGTVERNSQGDLEIKTGHLTAENTAAIGELSRRVLALEEMVKQMNEELKNGRQAD